MGYSIKVLSNKDFEKLPYSRISTSLGVADPRTNTAYIRYSSYPELNKYLIDHEFDHFVEEIPTDEFEGVRYKDFGKVIGGFGKIAQTVAPFVAMANPALGAGMSVAGGAASGGGRGAVNAIPSALGNFFGGGQAFAANAAAPNAFSGITSAGKGVNVGMGRGVAGVAGNATGGGGFLNKVLDWFGKNPQQALGAGSVAAGLFKGFPKVPELPQSVEDARSRVQSGGSALGQFGQGKLQELMSQNYDPLSQPEIDASLRQLNLEQTRAEDQVRDLYRNLRPGTDPSSDNAFRRDLQEVQDQFARAKSDTVATRTRDTKSNFDQQRLAQIQTSLGASEQDMQQLIQIAQMDVERIMAQLGLDVQQAQLFKQTFLDLGSALLGDGQQQNQLATFNIGV